MTELPYIRASEHLNSDTSLMLFYHSIFYCLLDFYDNLLGQFVFGISYLNLDVALVLS